MKKKKKKSALLLKFASASPKIRIHTKNARLFFPTAPAFLYVISSGSAASWGRGGGGWGLGEGDKNLWGFSPPLPFFGAENIARTM